MKIHTTTNEYGDEAICESCIARHSHLANDETLAVVEVTSNEANELLCGACHGPLA